MQVSLKDAPTGEKSVASPLVNLVDKSNLQTLLWIILGIGIFLRLFHFFDNRSLWTDEIYLANSLIRLDFLSLATGPLEYEQKAPIGFLWLSRLAVLTFGMGEQALRLFPLICSFLSLFLFIPVARYFLKPLGVLIAMVILAMAPPLVFHAVEAKQYSTELLATILLLYLYIHYHRKRDLKSRLTWGLLGATVILFSLSSVFVMAGLATAVSLHYLIRKDWNAFFRTLLPFSIWFGAFAAYYIIFLSKNADAKWLFLWFKIRGAFMPLPPTSVADAKWFVHVIYDFQRYPLGLMWSDLTHDNQLIRVLMRMPLLPLLFLALGIYALGKENLKHCMMLVFPLLITMLASGIKLYPFYERLIIFLAPLVMILIAYGCVWAFNKAESYGKIRYVLPALLLAAPVVSSAKQLINTKYFGDYKRSQQRSAFIYVNERFQPKDEVYVNWNSLHSYRYYKPAYNLQYKAIMGEDPRFISNNYNEYFANLQPQLKALDGKKRVWLIYHRRVWLKIGDYDEQPAWYFKENAPGGGDLLYKKFKAMGKEIDSYQTGEFNVSLFDLSEE